VLTSKLIDGTFPDYQRVIPTGNDKDMTVDRQTFAAAVDRVSTVSSERGRAVKIALADGQMTLTVNNPDSGSATEELAVDYSADPMEIGFNARYLLDITNQITGQELKFTLADAGSPTLDHRHGRREFALRADADARVTGAPAPGSTMTRKALAQLKLTAFRNYASLAADFEPGTSS
jgi:DNA polymerase III sliding clamp (beta) subunit (PCNA family)